MEDFQKFKICCLNSNKEQITAEIKCWKEVQRNITFDDVFYPYIILHYFEYKDDNGLIEKSSGSRVGDAFNDLYAKLQNKDVKMLVKGCSLKYYKVKHTYNTLYTHQLNLGERVDYKSPKVNIFETETDITQVVTMEEELKYYKKWLESIIDIPYE